MFGHDFFYETTKQRTSSKTDHCKYTFYEFISNIVNETRNCNEELQFHFVSVVEKKIEKFKLHLIAFDSHKH